MANALQRQWFNVGRPDTYTIIPIGDIHIGAAGCDETLLAETVKYIRAKKNSYWIGMGDYLDCINMSDPRFDVKTLAPWIKMVNLADLVEAQLDRFMKIIEPIADRCLCLLTGNHEDTILKYYERDIYREIVSRVKIKAGHPPDYQLGLDYYGWLILQFYSQDHTGDGSRATRLVFNLHHGFGGGKLKGAKALQMERWIYTHDADVTIFGHTHNADAYRAAVEYVDQGGSVQQQERRGVYSGTYLSNNNGGSTTYAERRGFLPLPIGGNEIVLKPQAHSRHDMIRVIT
jgi:hypothetical protein